MPIITGGAFLESLASHGVKPDAVTDVIFSHLHFDHIGWASRNGKPVFANATYRCDARDWEYFVDPPPELANQPLDPDNPMAPLVAPGSGKAVLEPVESRLVTWDADGSLLPGLDVRLAAGHTPGSGVMVLSSGTARAVLLGDVAHCPVELLDDEWGGIGDVDPSWRAAPAPPSCGSTRASTSPSPPPTSPASSSGGCCPARAGASGSSEPGSGVNLRPVDRPLQYSTAAVLVWQDGLAPWSVGGGGRDPGLSLGDGVHRCAVVDCASFPGRHHGAGREHVRRPDDGPDRHHRGGPGCRRRRGGLAVPAGRRPRPVPHRRVEHHCLPHQGPDRGIDAGRRHR